MITVGQLEGWRTDALETVGDELWRCAARLSGLDDQLDRLVGPSLSGAWLGVAADAAHASGARQAAELAGFAEQVATAARVLTSAAGAVAEAKAMLRRARAAAADGEATLDDAGNAVPPPPNRLLSIDDPAAALVRWLWQEDAAHRATILAQGALAAAEEADRDAARTLDALELAGQPLVLLGALLGPVLAGAPLRALVNAGLIEGIVLRDLPERGATAEQVALWWVELSPEQQQFQIRANPEAIGMLDGVPASARHAANLLVLRREQARAPGEVSRLTAELAAIKAQYATTRSGLAGGADPPVEAIGRRLGELEAELQAAIRRQEMLKSVAGQLEADSTRTLLLLDTAGEGRAAIGIGPVDTARHVAVVVPGLNQDVREEMGAIVSNAFRLERTASLLSPAVAGRERVATVAWIGYDTPNWAEVVFRGHAERGAVQLRSTLDGLDASREAARAVSVGDARPEPLHLTVVGHSYGSLTTGLAVRDATPVDDVAFIGSPGVGVDNASELSVPSGHVFVGEARGDPVADFARFEGDPNDPGFGAREFHTEGVVDPDTHETILIGSTGHSEHFEMNSESVHNLALITLGRGDLITPGHTRGLGDWLW